MLVTDSPSPRIGRGGRGVRAIRGERPTPHHPSPVTRHPPPTAHRPCPVSHPPIRYPFPTSREEHTIREGSGVWMAIAAMDSWSRPVGHGDAGGLDLATVGQPHALSTLSDEALVALALESRER